MVKSLLSSMTAAGLLLLASSTITNAFYLPGVAPTDYSDNDLVPVHVNSLTPTGSQQLKSIIPYDYYYKQFHFCAPPDIQAQSESLGSILSGDRLFNSPYELYMKKNETCKKLCVNQEIPQKDAIFINERIKENYAVRLMADGLPAARKKEDERLKEIFYSPGFELGEILEGKSFLHNHYVIHMQYHAEPSGTSRVVGVLVWPFSRQQTVDNTGAVVNCVGAGNKLNLDETKDKTAVHFTYDVFWVEDATTAWATRWDHYLHGFDPSIHWFSLVNSMMIVLFLTGMVALITLRALHKDISKYNMVEAKEDAQEDSGWKLVYGDVFRPPTRSMLLCIFVGSGAQLLAMTSVTLVFALFGFLSPSNRGSLVTVMILVYLVFESIAGFVSARMYKMFGGESWGKNVVFTSLLFPGIIFGMLLILNFFLISAQSSAAVPVGTMFAIVALWIIIGAPLSFVGSYFGFKKPRIEYPVRTNQIPRQIPEQIFYFRPIPSMLMGGVLPFGAIFIELYFIMNSVWGNRVYYLFGFASMVFMILVVTCSEVTILMCYFHLCSEDYQWWWRSFSTSGASAFYLFLYGCFYYYTKLEIDNFVSSVLYFGWTAIISVVFFVLTGTIGFIACFLFVRKIYGSIKVD